jgi:hypothetical protein
MARCLPPSALADAVLFTDGVGSLVGISQGDPMKLTSQQRRRLTMAVHGYGRARMRYGQSIGGSTLEIDWGLAEKLLRRADRAKTHLFSTVESLIGK